LRIFSR